MATDAIKATQSIFRTDWDLHGCVPRAAKLYRTPSLMRRSVNALFRAKMRMKSPLVIPLVKLPEFGVSLMFVPSEPHLEAMAAGEPERTEHRQIQIPSARTPELFDARVPEPDSLRLRPRNGIVVAAVCANLADLRHRFDEVRVLDVARRVQLGVARRDGERRPVERLDQPLICQS